VPAAPQVYVDENGDEFPMQQEDEDVEHAEEEAAAA